MLKHISLKLAAKLAALRERSVRAAKSIATLCFGTMVMVHQSALADLPAVVAPEGVEAGDYIGLWKALLKLGVNVIVLGIGAFAFYRIAAGGMTKWREYQKGQIDLSDMKEYFIGGSIVLVVIVALLTVANSIL
jgi:integrating conjugative element membrane protein (TIGR03745 family)